MSQRFCALHVHTQYSYDCLSSPKKIVEQAIKHRIDYLLISDHDSFEGSSVAKAYVETYQLPLEIPLAAEFKSDIGDIVVYGVSNPFNKISDHRELCSFVKEQKGETFLPHPYQNHKIDRIDYTHIDGIEVFNSRCKRWQNEKAIQLCQEKKKIPVYSSDAHFVRDTFRAICAFTGKTPLTEGMTPLKLLSTPFYKTRFSQIIKRIKGYL